MILASLDMEKYLAAQETEKVCALLIYSFNFMKYHKCLVCLVEVGKKKDRVSHLMPCSRLICKSYPGLISSPLWAADQRRIGDGLALSSRPWCDASELFKDDGIFQRG